MGIDMSLEEFDKKVHDLVDIEDIKRMHIGYVSALASQQ
jgi:hypothetical protein